MKIIEFDYNNVPTDLPQFNLVIGFFDGIHLGHKKLIEKAISSGEEVAMLSFDVPPSYVAGIRKSGNSLMSIDDKADYIDETFGIKYLLILNFNDECRNVSRLDFINKVLKIINPLAIYVGDDFKFGKDALGNVKFLSHYFKVYTVKCDPKNKISSRKIRNEIYSGDFNKGIKDLGHPYKMCGYVVKGLQNGVKIGFPTANIDLDFPYVIPSVGVYVGQAYVKENFYKAVICISTHPSIQALNTPIIEVHIIDFNETLYGDYISILISKKIREIIKFESLDNLKMQIKKDIEVAEKFFA